VVEYSGEFLARAAGELDSLPADSAIEQMLADYQMMRDQARVCTAANHSANRGQRRNGALRSTTSASVVLPSSRSTSAAVARGPSAQASAGELQFLHATHSGYQLVSGSSLAEGNWAGYLFHA
jgi:hypothetical protein